MRIVLRPVNARPGRHARIAGEGTDEHQASTRKCLSGHGGVEATESACAGEGFSAEFGL